MSTPPSPLPPQHPLVRIRKIYNEATITPNPTPPYDSTLLLIPPPPPRPNPDQPLGATAASLAAPIPALTPPLKIERVPVPSTDPAKHDRLQVVYSLSANIVTTARLRNEDNTPPTPNNPTGEPNPWEVGWLLWCFSPDPTHPYDPSPTSNSNFRFYAVVLKPNGWEVSKQDPSYKGGQRFLKSNDAKDPRKFPPHNTTEHSTPDNAVNPYSVLIKACHEYPLGTTPTQLENDIIPANRNSEAGNKARLTPSRNIFHVFVESRLLTTVVDSERPLPPHIPAFYAEDAHVRFTSMWHATPKRPFLRTRPVDYDPLALHATGYPPQGVVWF